MARPKEAILSQSLIRDQALAIIDEDGLGALTMRRLASRLGVQAASLYSHFANKDAVLDAVAERLAKRIDPAGFDAGWQHGLRTWANSYYSALHWHPNAAPMLLARAQASGGAEAVTDRVHQSLVEHGWPPRQAVMAATAVRFLVLGAATDAMDARRIDEVTDFAAADPLGEQLDTIEPPSFTMALDCLIRGLEAELGEAKSRGAQTRRRRSRSAAA
jgi:AcrR family transcriptional regulator